MLIIMIIMIIIIIIIIIKITILAFHSPLQLYTNGFVKQIISKEYKRRFFNDYVKVNCFIQT